jgi:hypothetical protein
LAIVLSDKYGTGVPGFMHVKWNDDLRSIVDFLRKNIDESLDKILNVDVCDSVPARDQKLD